MDVDQTAGPSSNPLAYLEHEEAASPATLKPYWTRIRTSYEKKLWHNMTVAIMDFVSREESGPYQIDLFEKFIRTVESKLNALKLAEIARRVGREYTEPELTLEFLQSFHARLPKPYPVPATAETPEVPAPPKPAPEAYALSLSSIAYAQLLLGDLLGCKKSLDECEKLLNEQDSVEPRVYAGYYGVAGDYYKVKAEYGPHYKSSLLYLACVDMDVEMDDTARRERARDLCIAALLGETIYNFGELLQHPVLASLKGTEKDWLRELISAFNAGEIGRFDSMTNHFSKEPILEASLPFLRQKICLMALIQAAFARPRDGSSKLMTFQFIAEATRLPVHEVEHLIMKALSLQLIRGTLDQVDSTADITWVQPRVLEGAQIDTLAGQFNAWTESVGRTEKDVDHWRAHAKKVVHAM